MKKWKIFRPIDIHDDQENSEHNVPPSSEFHFRKLQGKFASLDVCITPKKLGSELIELIDDTDEEKEQDELLVNSI